MNSVLYKKKWPLLIFLIPAFAFMLVFLYIPFFQNILNSFQSISGLGTAANGFNSPWYTNYVEMFNDPNMRVAVRNTIFMIVATVVFEVGVALILALMVDNIGRGAKFYRIVYFFPIVVSATALGLLFNLIFLYDKGMINQILEFLNVIDSNNLIDWKSENIALITMTIPVVWQYVGFYFVILITGLNNIPGELYEAAAIDGASKLQRIRFITLPLLYNVICTCIVLAVTGALKVFDLPWTMFPKGMPVGQTWLTGTYMYYQAFVTENVDYSSAIAVLIVILGIILSRVVNSVFKEKDY